MAGIELEGREGKTEEKREVRSLFLSLTFISPLFRSSEDLEDGDSAAKESKNLNPPKIVYKCARYRCSPSVAKAAFLFLFVFFLRVCFFFFFFNKIESVRIVLILKICRSEFFFSVYMGGNLDYPASKLA